MKKITQTKLTMQQKIAISSYTESLINTIFATKITDKEQLLLNLIDYSKNNSCPEAILKQTLVKGCFPKTTWTKKVMLDKTQVSPKIEISHSKEISDIRFLTELNIADKFANTSSLIKKVIFNSENPKHAVATISYGNMYKDVTINFNTACQELTINADIKSGNNALDAFKGVLGNLPVTDNYKPYNAINDYSQFTLNELQKQRLAYLKQYADNISNIKFNTHVMKIEEKMQALLDPITINYLVQDELLHCIALNVLKKQPSFFASHKVSVAVFKYFKQIEPHINASIFDNKENFNRFMAKAIGLYNDHVNDIAKNIQTNFWKGTGFENIADDIFK